MRFPHELQRDTMDCGPTCLKIITRYYGKSYPLAYLREASSASREGASLLGLSRAAEEIGFRTMAVRLDFEQLKSKASLPVIIHWNQNHFIVVYKITSKKVYVSDPAKGLLSYSHEQFVKSWISGEGEFIQLEGIALLFEPTPLFYEIVIPESQEGISPVGFLAHYIKPHRKLLLQVLLSLVAASILQLLIPFLTQNIIDVGILKKDINFIWLVLAAQLALTTGSLGLELLRGWFLLHISSRININLISDFFIKLMRLPLRYFDTRLTGDLMQRIQDHNRIESFLTGTTLNALFSVFTLMLYNLVLAWYSITLFGLFIAGSALYVGWIFFFLKKREKLDYKRFQQAGSTNSKVFELIGGMQEIKLHNAEQQKRWGWERIQVKLFHVRLASLKLEQVQSSGSRIINEIKNIFITVVAAKLVIDGQITLGMMMAVSYIIGQMNGPVIQLVNVIKSWQDARISLDRLTEIHLKQEETSREDIAKPLPVRQTIALENVSFQYDELSDPVLTGLHLEIPEGKITAIVGSSGSGKTTLLKLLMRFYKPTEGRILIDKTDLSHIDLYQWREKCGVVMQDGFIFNDTIAANIAVGDDTPDWDRVYEATHLANIQSYITSLPSGFRTKIGQEGNGISAGQKQRILIARAIYKNPSILFFDEATSALDANNEKEIMKNLGSFYKGKTVVLIAHRLSTVKNADNIVVLENGQIAEQGTHTSLAFKKGLYYRLISNQLELT